MFAPRNGVRIPPWCTEEKSKTEREYEHFDKGKEVSETFSEISARLR